MTLDREAVQYEDNPADPPSESQRSNKVSGFSFRGATRFFFFFVIGECIRASARRLFAAARIAMAGDGPSTTPLAQFERRLGRKNLLMTRFRPGVAVGASPPEAGAGKVSAESQSPRGSPAFRIRGARQIRGETARRGAMEMPIFVVFGPSRGAAIARRP